MSLNKYCKPVRCYEYLITAPLIRNSSVKKLLHAFVSATFLLVNTHAYGFYESQAYLVSQARPLFFLHWVGKKGLVTLR